MKTNAASPQIGKINRLKVLDILERGAYLDGGPEGQILLPTRSLPDTAEIGDELEVFLYLDSEDRLIATTEKPHAMLGEIAGLEVTDIQKVGAFLDWGLSKDLCLPFAEQTQRLRIGQRIVVALYMDNTERIAASQRISDFVSKDISELQEGQAVDLLIANQTDLGWRAVVEGKFLGVIYENEVFRDLQEGQMLPGFIKKIRDDQKLDLSLSRTGHQAGEDIAPLILEKLRENEGYLEINDKTSPQLIYEMFGVSKKKYKIAIGGLYKKRVIRIDDDGIRLTTPPTKSR